MWSFISYDKAMPNAKRLYANSSSVRSGIITGTQWDTACAWIESEKNSGGTPIHSVTNSISWGNFIDDTIDGNNGRKTTGSRNEWKAKNIYDFAGNTFEWTGEKRIDSGNTDQRINRSGCSNLSGSAVPTSYRNDFPSSHVNTFVSFRIVLYVL